MNNLKKIKKTLSDMFEKRERANDLYSQLNHSLALQELCPIAFERGTCSAGWKTNEAREPIFQISRSDDSTITFSFDDVSDFFKLQEASRRGITGNRFQHVRYPTPQMNGPIGQALVKFMRLRRRRGVVDG